MEKLINFGARPGLCHCPICERPNQKVGVTGIWRCTDGILVGLYGLCPGCTVLICRMPEAFVEQERTNVEAWLLEHYPHVESRLPKGYRPISTRPKKEKPDEPIN